MNELAKAKGVIARRKDNIFSGACIADQSRRRSGRWRRLGFPTEWFGCNPRGLMVRSPTVAAGKLKLKWLRGA